MQLRYVVEEKIKGKVIRVVERKGSRVYYYFNQEGVYRGTDLKNARFLGHEGFFNAYMIDDEKIFCARYMHYKLDCGINVENATLIRKAIARLKEGDTLEVFEQYLSSMKLEKHEKSTGLNRFVTKIERPIFARATGNNNKNTFDFIYVTVCIVQEWEEDHLTYVEKHKKEILKMVVERLEANKQFQKFGVPVNFLNAQATVTKDSTIEFIFELKKQ